MQQYELIKTWLDDSNSVSVTEMNEAYNSLFSVGMYPDGPNVCLMACLGAMLDSDNHGEYDLVGLVQNRIAKYEQEINW